MAAVNQPLTQLEDALDELKALIDSNNSQADPVATVGNIADICQNDISENDLPFCTSLLLHKEKGIFAEVEGMQFKKDRRFVSARDKLLTLLDEHMKRMGDSLAQYALEIKNRCLAIYRCDESNEVKVSALGPIIRMYQLTRDLERSKSSTGLKGRILHLLGMLCEYYPTEMFPHYKDITEIILTRLRANFQGAPDDKTEMQIITGALEGLTCVLKQFSECAEAANPGSGCDWVPWGRQQGEIYGYLRKSLWIPPKVKRYEVARAGLRLLATQGHLFRQHLTEDIEDVWPMLLVLCRMRNSDVRGRALLAVEGLMKEVASELVGAARQPEANRRTFAVRRATPTSPPRPALQTAPSRPGRAATIAPPTDREQSLTHRPLGGMGRGAQYFCQQFSELLQSSPAPLPVGAKDPAAPVGPAPEGKRDPAWDINIAMRAIGHFAPAIQKFQGLGQLKRTLHELFRFCDRLFAGSADVPPPPPACPATRILHPPSPLASSARLSLWGGSLSRFLPFLDTVEPLVLADLERTMGIVFRVFPLLYPKQRPHLYEAIARMVGALATKGAALHALLSRVVFEGLLYTAASRLPRTSAVGPGESAPPYKEYAPLWRALLHPDPEAIGAFLPGADQQRRLGAVLYDHFMGELLRVVGSLNLAPAPDSRPEDDDGDMGPPPHPRPPRVGRPRAPPDAAAGQELVPRLDPTSRLRPANPKARPGSLLLPPPRPALAAADPSPHLPRWPSNARLRALPEPGRVLPVRPAPHPARVLPQLLGVAMTLADRFGYFAGITGAVAARALAAQQPAAAKGADKAAPPGRGPAPDQVEEEDEMMALMEGRPLRPDPPAPGAGPEEEEEAAAGMAVEGPEGGADGGSASLEPVGPSRRKRPRPGDEPAHDGEPQGSPSPAALDDADAPVAAVAMDKDVEVSFFNRCLCHALLSRFLADTLGVIGQFKDELLTAVVQFTLAVPPQLMVLSRMVAALRVALQVGLLHLPLAQTAIEAMRGWVGALPGPVLARFCYPAVLPLLSEYLARREEPLQGDGRSMPCPPWLPLPHPSQHPSCRGFVPPPLLGLTTTASPWAHHPCRDTEGSPVAPKAVVLFKTKTLKTATAGARLITKARHRRHSRLPTLPAHHWRALPHRPVAASSAGDPGAPKLATGPLVGGIEVGAQDPAPVDEDDPDGATPASRAEGLEMKWDESPCVLFKLPFRDAKPELFLDSLLPRIVELAESSGDRQTKMSACELLHTAVLLCVGIDSSHDSAKEGKTPLHETYVHVFPAILRLGADPDPVTRTLFQPLVLQLVHWLTNRIKETKALVDACFGALVTRTNAALREFAATCLAEYLRWLLKHTAILTAVAESNDSTGNPMASFFERLCALVRHPNPAKRLGAAELVLRVEGLLRESQFCVDAFAIRLLCHSFVGLRLAHHDDPAFGTEDRLARVVGKLSRIVSAYGPLLSEPSRARPESDTVGYVVEFLWAETGRVETRCRTEAMALFEALVPVAVPPTPGNPSAKTWIKNSIQGSGRGGRFVTDVFDAGIDREPTFARGAPPDQLLLWMEQLLRSIDCHMWTFRAGFMPTAVVLLPPCTPDGPLAAVRLGGASLTRGGGGAAGRLQGKAATTKVPSSLLAAVCNFLETCPFDALSAPPAPDAAPGPPPPGTPGPMAAPATAAVAAGLKRTRCRLVVAILHLMAQLWELSHPGGAAGGSQVLSQSPSQPAEGPLPAALGTAPYMRLLARAVMCPMRLGFAPEDTKMVARTAHPAHRLHAPHPRCPTLTPASSSPRLAPSGHTPPLPSPPQQRRLLQITMHLMVRGSQGGFSPAQCGLLAAELAALWREPGANLLEADLAQAEANSSHILQMLRGYEQLHAAGLLANLCDPVALARRLAGHAQQRTSQAGPLEKDLGAEALRVALALGLPHDEFWVMVTPRLRPPKGASLEAVEPAGPSEAPKAKAKATGPAAAAAAAVAEAPAEGEPHIALMGGEEAGTGMGRMARGAVLLQNYRIVVLDHMAVHFARYGARLVVHPFLAQHPHAFDLLTAVVDYHARMAAPHRAPAPRAPGRDGQGGRQGARQGPGPPEAAPAGGAPGRPARWT
ncbi:putative DNA-dependent protein kinase catalytic subunit [Paratrimastix pyriformis]|uniref:DNA-dependent protein kinase catalytic subunit n=1 Tax=Paratrimastix pyriformis TaxID=342808 RepID=A0ABQ8USC9_9EUKA|nr:putative DNA-dependent protein kinase catalytic subunit [Paratrimastix pyriformis]